MNDMVQEKDRGLRSILIILTVYAATLLLTAGAAVIAESPFSLWFRDTPIVLLAVLIYIVILAVVWDGLLISIGLISETWHRGKPSGEGATITVESTRGARFFTCGPSPLIIIVMTAFVLLGTSNITLINLKLLGTITEWRDPFFWKIEGPIFEWLSRSSIHAGPWDKLYHSCWGTHLFAAFVLVLLGRSPRIVLHFCLSLILLFYVGRFLGIVNPVMGPAFFRPELFGYLSGTITEIAMHRVAAIQTISPERAVEAGGVLLGGVSAMPSLHVAMVALTAYWLATAKRWTLFITVPWVLLVWASTVILGWHYILDGAGGVILAAACIWATHWGLRAHGIGIPSTKPSLFRKNK
jgi:membrane-associated phospholipid phosphatase